MNVEDLASAHAKFVADFLKRCDRYCLAAKISAATLSTAIFGTGKGIERLRGGAGVSIRVLKRADERLAARETTLTQDQAA